jgi:hypothetical protein
MFRCQPVTVRQNLPLDPFRYTVYHIPKKEISTFAFELIFEALIGQSSDIRCCHWLNRVIRERDIRGLGISIFDTARVIFGSKLPF